MESAHSTCVNRFRDNWDASGAKKAVLHGGVAVHVAGTEHREIARALVLSLSGQHDAPVVLPGTRGGVRFCAGGDTHVSVCGAIPLTEK